MCTTPHEREKQICVNILNYFVTNISQQLTKKLLKLYIYLITDSSQTKPGSNFTRY